MLHHDPQSPLSSLARAAAALAAVVVTCSVFYGVIAGMAGDPWATPLDLSVVASQTP
jgi:hypothetical protein